MDAVLIQLVRSLVCFIVNCHCLSKVYYITTFKLIINKIIITSRFIFQEWTRGNFILHLENNSSKHVINVFVIPQSGRILYDWPQPVCFCHPPVRSDSIRLTTTRMLLSSFSQVRYYKTDHSLYVFVILQSDIIRRTTTRMFLSSSSQIL